MLINLFDKKLKKLINTKRQRFDEFDGMQIHQFQPELSVFLRRYVPRY